MKKIPWLLTLALLCSPNFVHAKNANDGAPKVAKIADDDEEEAEEDEMPAKTGGGKKAAGPDEEEGSEKPDDDGGKTATTLPSSTKAAMVGKVGKTIGVSIDEKGKQDFDFDLPKGQFMLYCDAQRIGDGSLTSSIDSSLKILKRNGSALPQYSGEFIYWNSHEKEYRVGKAFSFTKPTGVRIRLTNQSNGENNFWLTVVPAAPFKFLPYGFEAKIISGKIGPNNGAGGTLDSREFAYVRAKMPAGKWNVSLGTQDKEGRCYVSLLALDERGLDFPQSFSLITSAGDYGGEAREEKTITLTKPKTMIFRVYNEGAANKNPATYDVTIEPATD